MFVLVRPRGRPLADSTQTALEIVRTTGVALVPGPLSGGAARAGCACRLRGRARQFSRRLSPRWSPLSPAEGARRRPAPLTDRDVQRAPGRSGASSPVRNCRFGYSQYCHAPTTYPGFLRSYSKSAGLFGVESRRAPSAPDTRRAPLGALRCEERTDHSARLDAWRPSVEAAGATARWCPDVLGLDQVLGGVLALAEAQLARALDRLLGILIFR